MDLELHGNRPVAWLLVAATDGRWPMSVATFLLLLRWVAGGLSVVQLAGLVGLGSVCSLLAVDCQKKTPRFTEQQVLCVTTYDVWRLYCQRCERAEALTRTSLISLVSVQSRARQSK